MGLLFAFGVMNLVACISGFVLLAAPGLLYLPTLDLEPLSRLISVVDGSGLDRVM
jgi:hypothetical protein